MSKSTSKTEEYIELNVDGKIIKTKYLRNLSMSSIRQLHLDNEEVGTEYFELVKAMKTLEMCLVNSEDAELISALSIDEFTELLQEWIEMQHPDATTL